MDIYHESLRHFLSGNRAISLRLIDLYSGGGIRGLADAWRLLMKLCGDFFHVVLNRAGIVVMSYPGIPFAPLTSRWKLPAAYLTYGLWALRAKLTGQRLALLVADLPIEQAEDLGLPIFVDKARYKPFERFLFGVADTITVFSPDIQRLIAQQHGLPAEKFRIIRRLPHMPLPGTSSLTGQELDPNRIQVLYAGELSRPQDIANLRQVFAAVEPFPGVQLNVCGPRGEWMERLQLPQVRYWGMLNHSDFDALAGQCHVGLIIYPRGPYYDRITVAKYSAYAANGLAMLATDITRTQLNLAEDGLGVALPLPELLQELARWCEEPARFAGYKQQAEAMAPLFRHGAHAEEWLKTILKDDVK